MLSECRISYLRKAALIILSLAACSTLGLRPVKAQIYIATQLPISTSGTFPAQMHDDGNGNTYIVGGTLISFSGGAVQRSFRWDNVSNTMTLLPQIDRSGTDTMVAFGVNVMGNSVGITYLNIDDATENGLMWTGLTSTPTDLPPFASAGYYSEAFGINASNLMVGNSNQNMVSPYDYHGIEWSISGGNVQRTDIGLLMGGYYSLLFAVNDSGVACGSGGTNVGNMAGQHALTFSSGTLTDLGTLGGRNSAGSAINSKGEVVGKADLVGVSDSTSMTPAGPEHAFIWLPTGDTNYGLGSGMHDLGTIPGYDSYEAISKNDSGQVTGRAYNSSNTASPQYGGFVWDSVNGMRDINAIAPVSGIQLSDVINNNLNWLASVGDDGMGHRYVYMFQPH